MGALKHTPLFAAETAEGAKMVPVRGWSLPAYYPGGALGEYRHTRSGCSLFDLSHPEKFRIAGTGAAAALDREFAAPCSGTEIGGCRYDLVLDADGGIVGEAFVHRMAEEDFFVTAEAAGAGMLPLLGKRLPEALELQDLSASLAVLALCGPESERTLRELVEETVVLPGADRHTMLALDDFRCIASRINFAGVPEYRFFCRADAAEELREFFLESSGIRPAGMTAREMLRIEAGVPAFPSELNMAHTPLECGLDGFGGPREPRRQLKFVKFAGRRAAPPNSVVLSASGDEVGRVTSGALSPAAEAAFAFCDLDAAFPAPAGTVLTVKNAAETLTCVVVTPPQRH